MTFRFPPSGRIVLAVLLNNRRLNQKCRDHLLSEERSDSVRILLCDQKPNHERSLLLDILQHHVLGGEPVFTVVTAPGHDAALPVVKLDDLDEAMTSTQPDVVLVLADAIGLERARKLAQLHRSTEVVAITRTGYMMVDLEPARLAAVLRALVEARNAEQVARPVAMQSDRLLRVER